MNQVRRVERTPSVSMSRFDVEQPGAPRLALETWELPISHIPSANPAYTPTVCAFVVNNCLSTYCKIPPFA
jgi:hypothetical protein